MRVRYKSPHRLKASRRFQELKLAKHENEQRRQVDDVPCKSAELISTLHHLMGLQNSLSEGDHWSQCVQSRYTEVINLRFHHRAQVSTMGLCPLQVKITTKHTIQLDPCDSKGYTHSDNCIQLTQFPDGKEGDRTAW